jgi:hypothetical protein
MYRPQELLNNNTNISLPWPPLRPLLGDYIQVALVNFNSSTSSQYFTVRTYIVGGSLSLALGTLALALCILTLL